MATSHPYIIGVDPGLNGAIAVVSRLDMSLMFCMDMPCNKVPSKRHKAGFKREVNGLNIGQALYKYAPQTAIAVVERVGSRPGEGRESVFKFGHAAGLVEGVLNGLALQVVKPHAAAWKLTLGLSSKKEDSLRMARELWPNEAELFKYKKNDGRAEAALLAYWAIKHGFK